MINKMDRNQIIYEKAWPLILTETERLRIGPNTVVKGMLLAPRMSTYYSMIILCEALDDIQLE